VSILSACSAEQRRIEQLDNGPTIGINGIALEPLFLPVKVIYEQTPVINQLVSDAETFWNNSVSRDGVKRTVVEVVSIDTVYYDDCIVLIQTGLNDDVVPDQEKYGIHVPEKTELSYTRYGLIRNAIITLDLVQITKLNLSIKRLGETVVRHGLGHFLGLDDDSGPPTTVDLKSVMANPVDILGELTSKDFDYIKSYYDRAVERRKRFELSKELDATLNNSI
jgi:hypothetical protein